MPTSPILPCSPSLLDFHSGGDDYSDAILAAMASGASCVIVPKGVYRHEISEIVLPEGFTFKGVPNPQTTGCLDCPDWCSVLDGPDGWRLRIDQSNTTVQDLGFTSDGAFKLDVQPSTTDIKNINLCNLRIDKQNENAASHDHGISFRPNGGLSTRNFYVKNCCVTYAGATNINFGSDNIYVASYDSDGTGTVEDGRIWGCWLRIAGRQNISIAGAGESQPKNILIEKSIVEDSTLAGIDVERAESITVRNVEFIRSGTNQSYVTTPLTLRAGLAHFGDGPLLVEDCVLRDCERGFVSQVSVGGALAKATLNRCHFINSPIENLGARFGFAEFNDCIFESTDPSLPHLINVFAPQTSWTVNGGEIKGPTANEQVRLWQSNDPGADAIVHIFDGVDWRGVGQIATYFRIGDFRVINSPSIDNYSLFEQTALANDLTATLIDNNTITNVTTVVQAANVSAFRDITVTNNALSPAIPVDQVVAQTNVTISGNT